MAGTHQRQRLRSGRIPRSSAMHAVICQRTPLPMGTVSGSRSRQHPRPRSGPGSSVMHVPICQNSDLLTKTVRWNSAPAQPAQHYQDQMARRAAYGSRQHRQTAITGYVCYVLEPAKRLRYDIYSHQRLTMAQMMCISVHVPSCCRCVRQPQ